MVLLNLIENCHNEICIKNWINKSQVFVLSITNVTTKIDFIALPSYGYKY